MNEKEVVEVTINDKAVNGQYKCPNCGASDITFKEKKGKLVCNYCGCEFEDKIENNQDLKKLKGTVVSKGTRNIKADAKDVITLKCGGCGAEVVIDTKDLAVARCHWCRSILTINDQIENGTIPDMLLPFKTTKEEAQIKINEFVSKRRFYANKSFKKEFTTENIMGVYFPYMLVDANIECDFAGIGEHKKREYYVGSDDNRRKVYDADVYNVERKFDMTIDDLSIESNSDRIDKVRDDKTNNIINSVMPFDTENCVKYTGNYLLGYSSEKRDMNVEDLEEKSNKQIKTIARINVKKDLTNYDRGLCWSKEEVKMIGKSWAAAYLPIWLYSYQEVKGDKKTLHYVAVNARTNETMGSIPINKPLLLLISSIIEIICGILGIILFILAYDPSADEDSSYIFLALFAAGFIYYGVIYNKYRNKDARHKFESETKTEMNIKERKDEFIETKKGLSNSRITGCNSDRIEE